MLIYTKSIGTSTSEQVWEHERTTPSTHGSPLRYQTGSGRIASPNNSLTSGLSLRFWSICCVMELVNLSWLFAYFMNATQVATPSVPRTINAGHLRYQTVNANH